MEADTCQGTLPQKEFLSLQDWLYRLEKCHPNEIELGLDRIRLVANRLNIERPSTKIITVAGTNGKGSCVAVMEKILTDNGLRVGSYTSPHISHYNERVKVQCQPVDNATLCDAFEKISCALEGVSLTYFEFGTLAAFLIFTQQHLDYWLLEVGLGGRLDAVNLLDPDIAIITSIDLDHEEWLGDTREDIAKEKLGILRPGISCICGEPDPPANLFEIVESLQVDCLYIGRDFSSLISTNKSSVIEVQIRQSSGHKLELSLQKPNLPLNSVAAALQAIALCGELPSVEILRQRLPTHSLAGRFEIIDLDSAKCILDVAHNPAAVQLLAKNIRGIQHGSVIAIVGMMADKKVEDSLRAMCSVVDYWMVTEFEAMRRSETKQRLAKYLTHLGVGEERITICQNVAQAIKESVALAQKLESQMIAPLIVVFGSFITVSLAHDYFDQHTGIENS